jgi:hypothetical protein
MVEKWSMAEAPVTGMQSRTNNQPSRPEASERGRPLRRRFDLTPKKVAHARPHFRWASGISEAQWSVYRRAMQVVRDAGVPFLLGGGFALATFTGRWRDTKDIDFYILPRHRQTVIDALTKAGFKDYYPRLRYDRGWIYRSIKSDVIVDIIWSMANRRARVDELWFKRSSPISIRGESLNVLPLEEFLWCKLYILQRDHCDWTDILNLLYAAGPRIDWHHLIERVEEDTALLRGLLSVYSWLCPKRAAQLPSQLWPRLQLPPPQRASPKRDRIRLLDSRAWFAALQRKNEKLEV